MKKPESAWMHSIFFRLVTILLLIMVPVYAAGMIIYNWGIRTVREEISKSMQSKAEFYLSSIENEIDRIQILQYDALADENLYMLASVPESMNEYEKTKAILRLQQRLNAIKNSSIYIRSISAYIPSLAKSIAADAIDNADSHAFLSTSMASDARINFWNDKLILIARYPLPYQTAQRASQYMIEIELSIKELENALSQINRYADSGTFLYSPQWNHTLSENSGDADFVQILHAITQDDAKREGNDGEYTLKVNGKSYLIIQTASSDFNLLLASYIPEKQVFNHLETYKFWFWCFTMILVVIVIIFSASIYKIIHQPLVKLVSSFRRVEQGNLDISIEHRHNNEFGYLYTRFNVMTKSLNALIDQVYKQKILAQHAELKHLQSQINPHFLYNSFFILYNMVVTEDYDNVAVFTKQLGNYFEFITRNESDDVPLAKEVAHSRVYADIQGRRFRNRIVVVFADLPEHLAGIMVPRLIIQPVIENAFEHGLKNKASDGFVRIYFDLKNRQLFIVVEDNGDELTDSDIDKLNRLLTNPSDERASTGMINIHKRVQIKFGEASGVSFSRGAHNGLKAVIKLTIVEIMGGKTNA